MKHIGLLIISFIPFCCFSQTKDPIVVSAKYRLTYIKDGAKLVDDICQLDITKSGSYFYSLGFNAEMEAVNRKFTNASQSNARVNFVAGDFRHDLFPFNTVKDYNQKTATQIERIGTEFLGYVKDTLNNRSWMIAKDEKKIGTLIARKAVQERKGNRITAWFCKEVPFQDGPMYYYGLPGLIVSANTNLGWQIDLIDLKYNSDSKRTLSILPYRSVSIEQFKKAQKNYAAQLQNGALPNGDKIEKAKY